MVCINESELPLSNRCENHQNTQSVFSIFCVLRASCIYSSYILYFIIRIDNVCLMCKTIGPFHYNISFSLSFSPFTRSSRLILYFLHCDTLMFNVYLLFKVVQCSARFFIFLRDSNIKK